MTFLYVNRKDVTINVDIKTYDKDKIKLSFSCDGGKFGTDELLNEFNMTAETLLIALEQHFK